MKFYNARISLQYTSISCITYPAKQLIEHTFISCQFNKQVYCFVYFQDALDAAKILEPQHPEPLASSESAGQGKRGFYNAQISLQYTSISCITYPVKQLIEHMFISCQFSKQVYCFVYFQDALDTAKILEPQHPEPLASSESAGQGK